jgi:hypothetical protein
MTARQAEIDISLQVRKKKKKKTFFIKKKNPQFFQIFWIFSTFLLTGNVCLSLSFFFS